MDHFISDFAISLPTEKKTHQADPLFGSIVRAQEQIGSVYLNRVVRPDIIAEASFTRHHRANPKKGGHFLFCAAP